jgi:hypothetical protein
MAPSTPVQRTSPATSPLAVVSLIAGILGLTIAWGLGSLVAIITGTMALREIRTQPEATGGEGTARAGVVLGWVGLGLTVLVVCAFCAFFLLLVPAYGLLSRTAEPTSQWLGMILAA